MRGSMLALATACVVIGLVPAFFWPAIARVAGEWNSAWADSDMPASLVQLGMWHVALAVCAVLAGILLWQRTQRSGLKRQLTWDCGYAVPTPRMQYTAASFAGTITEWFAWILRPVRHEHRVDTHFPVTASLTDHTPETVLECLVEPAGGLIMRVSRMIRRLQHGRVQSYVLYVIIGLSILAAWVFTE